MPRHRQNTRKPRKAGIKHAEIVRVFSRRLRELRQSRGLTQFQLAELAHITVAYVGRLENGGAAPGIDLADRLARALGTVSADLLTPNDPDALAALKNQARELFEAVLRNADRDALMLLNPFLSRMSVTAPKGR